MTPDAFLNKILDLVNLIKTPLVLILLTVAILKIAYASFVGSHADDRGIYSQIGTLFILSALLFSLDKIIPALQSIFGG